MGKRDKTVFILACAAAIVTNVLWGLSFIGSKRSMELGFQPFTLVTVRFVVCTLALLPVALVKKEKLKVDRKDILPMIASALTGVTVYFFFELEGVKRLSASTAALFIVTIPVMTLLYSIFFKRKRPSVICYLSMAVSLVGVYLVVASDSSGDSVQGALFMLSACVCWVAYIEISQVLLKKYTLMTVTLWQGIISLITLAPMYFTEKVDLRAIPAEAWMWSALFLGFLCSAVAYVLNNYSISKMSSLGHAVFLNLNPLAAAVGGWLILGEAMTGKGIIGGVIVLVSVFILTLTERDVAE
ncbi:MAG: DMT family transporter [Clostridiales bacterium]|nr:DMT family transporter [Clostridiales bacterium]